MVRCTGCPLGLHRDDRGQSRVNPGEFYLGGAAGEIMRNMLGFIFRLVLARCTGQLETTRGISRYLRRISDAISRCKLIKLDAPEPRAANLPKLPACLLLIHQDFCLVRFFASVSRATWQYWCLLGGPVLTIRPHPKETHHSLPQSQTNMELEKVVYIDDTV